MAIVCDESKLASGRAVPDESVTTYGRTKSATASSSRMSMLGEGVVNSENNIRANHSVAVEMSMSLRTSPVTRAADDVGREELGYTPASRVAAFLVIMRLTSCWSK